MKNPLCLQSLFLEPHPETRVKVSFDSAGGPAIVTEADVESIESGTEVIENTPGAPIRRQVAVRLTETAADRIAEYARTHVGEMLALDFHGRLAAMEVKKDWTAPGAARNVTLDIASLGMTLEQFEQDDLAAGQ